MRYISMAIVALTPFSIFANTNTWTANSSSNVWSTGGNWSGTSPPPGATVGATDVATFSGNTTPYTAPNITSNTGLYQINFGSTSVGYDLTEAGNVAFYMNPNGGVDPSISTATNTNNSQTISAPIVLNANLAIYQGMDLGIGYSLTIGSITDDVENYGVTVLPAGGSSPVIFNGTSSYKNTTTINSGATLGAGSTSGFSQYSDFVVDGTLDLRGYNNTINTLSGNGGTVQSAVDGSPTLTISNGGTFDGSITSNDDPSEGLGISLVAGTLNLLGVCNYYGNTIVPQVATLSAGSESALSANSSFTVDGYLLLNGYSNTVGSLNGSGIVNMGTGGFVPTLSIVDGDGETFYGSIIGLGNLTLEYGALTLTPTGNPNSYSGLTTLEPQSTLTAGGVNAFSPLSAFQLTNGSDWDDHCTLDLGGYNNTIYSLSGDQRTKVILDSAILTINGGQTTTYSGRLTNTLNGSLTIDGGTYLILAKDDPDYPSDYQGPTTIIDGTLEISAAPALSSYTPITIDVDGALIIDQAANISQAMSVWNSGTLTTSAELELSSTYTQTALGALDINFYTTGNTGSIVAGTGMSLSGTLNVINNGSPDYSDSYVLLSTTSGTVSGEFTTFTSSGFSQTPHLSYSLNSVELFFMACENNWTYQATNAGYWNDGNNWGDIGSNCVPGVNGNDDDSAYFNELSQTTMQITLANDIGTLAQPVTLYEMYFDAPYTAYTITAFSDASTITFDSAESDTALITVETGYHTIDAPIILNLDTELTLYDGWDLTFDSGTTMVSSGETWFEIEQNGPDGTGELINNGTLTPYGFVLYSAMIENNATIAPTGELYIETDSGDFATVNNTGSEALFGPSGSGGIFTVDGAGTISITNSGIGAMVGPTGMDAVMTVNTTGVTTIVNDGVGAFFGTSGVGGSLSITGSDGVTITNSGFGVVLGSTGVGGSTTLNSGTTITNSLGALIQAGYGAVLTIDGASITNDVTSTIGTETASIDFTSGSIETSGKIYAFDYYQGGTSTLQIDLVDVPLIAGKVIAEGTATVLSNLVVDALPGSIVAGQTVELISANRGVFGSFYSVDFLNFPVGVIPQLVYLADAVDLVTSPTVSSNAAGYLSQLAFTSTNEGNMLIQRDIHTLNNTIRQRNQRGGAVAYNDASEPQVSALEDADDEMRILKVASLNQRTQREQNRLANNKAECMPNASRFYFGPIDSFGSFSTKGNSQTGFGFNAVGVYTGIDHAFDTCGLGLVAEYSNTRGNVKYSSGHFGVEQLQGSVYATWVPDVVSQAFSVDLIGGYGYDWIVSYRKAGPAADSYNAKCKTQGMIADALLGFEYCFSHRQFDGMPCNIYVTPLVNVQYIWSRIAGYDEINAGLYQLNVGTQVAQSLKPTVGARFEYLVERDHFTFKPELDLAWQYECLDHSRNLNFTTLNVPITQSIVNTAIGAGRNTILVGVDFFFTMYKVFELEISYDFQWNNIYTDNTFYLGVGGNF